MFPNYQSHLYNLDAYHALRNATVDNTSRSSSRAREVEAPPSRYSSSGWADSPPDDSPVHSYSTPYEDNSTASHGDRRRRGESSTQRRLLNEFGNLGLKQKNRRDNASPSPSRSPSPPPRVPIQDSPVHSTSGAWGYTEAATWPDVHYQSSDSFHGSHSHYPISHQSSGWLSSTLQHFLPRRGWQQDYSPQPHNWQQDYSHQPRNWQQDHSHQPRNWQQDYSHQPHNWQQDYSHQPHNWQQDYSHQPYNWHSAYSSSADVRYKTVSGREIRHTRGLDFPQDTKGCAITCIAMVANISYREARQAAVDAVNARPSEEGLGFDDAHTVLEKIGVDARWYKPATAWSHLPDLAIVSVYGSQRSPHAVVFARLKEGEYIFDCNKNGPVLYHDYELYPDYSYIEIR